ncbi:protein kinase C delta type-like [Brachyhypopomus gauderio]|uniref:protein kinase C delta type-like n=1 Tax=Brachyhypopomus gauderio TaxID=698409 RepID=UPI0040413EF5
MKKWKDIKRCCLWSWCCGGIQDDSDTEEEPRRDSIKKKKRKNKTGPKQETDNAHGQKTPVNKSALDEAWEELLHVLLDETEDSSNPEGPLNNEDEACEKHIDIVLDQIEVSCVQPLETHVEESSQGEGPRPLSQISQQTRITAKDFTFHKLLGKGAFGKVFLAELKGREAWFAVKALKKNRVLKSDNVESTMVEKRVLTLASDCPFLAHLYCTFQTKEYLFFVMECLNGGNLMFHMKMKGRFDLDRTTFYAAELVCGLQFLHGKGVIHRDLKLDNVILDRDGHIKIADFGMCKENVFGHNLATSYCGTPHFIAPEILLEEPYSFSVDWWSFGVLVYVMLTGQPPFIGDDEEEILESVRSDTPLFPLSITWNARKMLIRLFERDPSRRLGVVGNIRGHSFFETIDWPALERKEIEPPYKPNVTSHNDCSNIDMKFLNEKPLLSKCRKHWFSFMDQSDFAGFSFTNESMEHLLQT